MSKRPELMAPAGSMAALRAAVAAGADAVYLGGKQFSARQSAQNFDHDELRQAIRLAHQSNAKIYVTVNTLLKSEELPAAVAFLREIYNLGADAAIVQDPGLIAMARETTPNLELHASTQLTIHNAAGVRAMQRLGISRVVLARELAADEIRQIRSQTEIGLEAFLHGALCIAYSGQCLFSSLTGGRSGNRGQCAQPCRLPYRLAGGNLAGQLLSPKDLCLYPRLPELLALGLDALKIEGRLKRPSYVATVVRCYRTAIDCLLAGQAMPSWQEVQTDLLQAFNRGFTSGYFPGKPGTGLLQGDQSGHMGVAVGRVRPNGRLEWQQELAVGDILRTGVDQEYRVPVVGKPAELPGLTLAPGEPIFRLQNAKQERLAETLVADFTPKAEAVAWQARLAAGAPLQLTAAAAGKTVTVSGEQLPEPAVNRPVDEALLERQLGKTGTSGFSFGSLTAEIDGDLAIPVSEINLCRRLALEQLGEQLWGQARPLPEQVSLPAPLRCPLRQGTTRLAVAVADKAALAAVLPLSPDRVYFGTTWYRYAQPVTALAAYHVARATANAAGASCYLRLPRIMHPREEALWQQALQGSLAEGLYVSNWAGVNLARRLGLPFVVAPSLNATNSYFLSTVPDAESFYLSAELNRAEVLELLQEQGQKAALEIHSRQLLMVHEQCLLGANGHCLSAGRGCNGDGDYLVDRKGYRFPLRGDVTCRSYLYNSQVCSLVDQVPELLAKQTVAELLLDLELETPERIAELGSHYRTAWGTGDRGNVRNDLQQLYPEGITRGHWRRGV